MLCNSAVYITYLQLSPLPSLHSHHLGMVSIYSFLNTNYDTIIQSLKYPINKKIIKIFRLKVLEISYPLNLAQQKANLYTVYWKSIEYLLKIYPSENCAAWKATQSLQENNSEKENHNCSGYQLIISFLCIVMKLYKYFNTCIMYISRY